MKPGHIDGATRVLNAPIDWDESKHGTCGGLPIRDSVLDSGLPCMTSVWFPSSKELARIAAGTPIMLHIIGETHPPVSIGVGAWQGPAK